MKINKQFATALFVFVLLGALAAVLNLTRPITASHKTSSIILSDRATGALASVRIKNSYGSYTITREGDDYSCAQLQLVPTSYKAMETFAEHCTKIEATSGIRVPESAVDMGFDKPRAVAEITFTDNSQLTLTIGAKREAGDGYYARLAADGPVYLLSEADTAPFLAEVSSFVDLQLTTDAGKTEQLPTRISLSSGLSSLTVSSLPATVTDCTGALYDYTVTDQTDSGYADTDRLHSFFDGLFDLRARSVVQLFPTADELKSYGILTDDGTPATLLSYAYKGAETRLYIGNRSGDYYYVYKEGVAAVYAVTLENACWDGVAYYPLMARHLLAPLPQSVASITVTTSVGSYDILLDDSGETGSVNGEPLSDRTFGQLYQLLFSVEAQYPMEQAADPTLPELTLTVLYREQDAAGQPRTDVLRLIPYGLRRHAIELNGVAHYAVRSGYVQQVTETLRTLHDGVQISTSW